MDYSEALTALKNGHRVARSGWNGKGMWIALTPGSTIANENARNGAALILAKDRPGDIVINGHIDMKAADGSIVVGWLASQTDMLAADWGIIGYTAGFGS
jgi:hypothetical protein